MINKYKIINECYKKAEYFINLASNSLSIFEENQDKNILKKGLLLSDDIIFLHQIHKRLSLRSSTE